MSLVAQVISNNKLRWFGRVMRRGQYSTLRVDMKLKMKGKRPIGKPERMWLDNGDGHMEGNNTSLKEVLETKCFENKDQRMSISI